MAYDSGRLEWADMNLKRKVWYIIVSLLYTAVIGGVGGVSIAGAVHFLRNGPWKAEGPFGTLEQGIGTLTCAPFISVCQTVRVFRSRQRSKEQAMTAMATDNSSGQDAALLDEPYQPAFWFSLQRLALFLMVAPAVLGWLIAFFR
jgi:hypothetical protein